ncbi:hypothetical protein ACIQCF_17180 [Streptomyces sp. NPDC088353]|uniref:hypothetical protein n=1 Tax=Streptomyces sp. NPDC088353 TaxID=3365855 RepID=UPI003803B9E3
MTPSKDAKLDGGRDRRSEGRRLHCRKPCVARKTRPRAGDGAHRGQRFRCRAVAVAVAVAAAEAAAAGQDVVGTLFIGESNAGYSTGAVGISGSNTGVSAYVGNPTATAAVWGTVPQVFAVGDRIRITAVHEAAN